VIWFFYTLRIKKAKIKKCHQYLKKSTKNVIPQHKNATSKISVTTKNQTPQKKIGHFVVTAKRSKNGFSNALLALLTKYSLLNSITYSNFLIVSYHNDFGAEFRFIALRAYFPLFDSQKYILSYFI
jgi:hypothetical protein